MRKSELLESIRKNGKIYRNPALKEYILSFDSLEKQQLCYLSYFVTDFNLEKTKTIMCLKNKKNIDDLLILLDNKIIEKNSRYLREELTEENARERSIINGYLTLLNDEKFSSDFELLDGIIKCGNIKKVLKMLDDPNYIYYEDAFRKVMCSKNNVARKNKTKFLAAIELDKLGREVAFEEQIKAKEFKHTDNVKRLTNEEFDHFIKKCMENDVYRDIYSIMYVLVSLDPFKKVGKKNKDKSKLLSKMYDLSESHGQKRLNAYINQMKKEEITRKHKKD